MGKNDFIVKSQTEGISFCNCLYYGWLLFRKNGIFVTGFSIILCCSNIFITVPSNLVFSNVTNSIYSASTFLVFLAESILWFTAIVFISVKLLLVLHNRKTELVSVFGSVHRKANKLLISWMIIQLIRLAPVFVVKMLSKIEVSRYLDFNKSVFISFFTNTFSELSNLIELVAKVILVFIVCCMIDDRSEEIDRSLNTVFRASLSMGKRTIRKLLLLYLLYLIFVCLTAFFLIVIFTYSLIGQIVVGLLRGAFGLFGVIVLTIIYFYGLKPSNASDETIGEE